MDHFAHCEALVREADRDRFLASLFAPIERRRDLFALYAFNIELGRVRELAREPMPGEIRLQWWREVIEGQRSSEAAAHPVAAALVEVMTRHRLATEPLLAMIEARAFDLYDDPMRGLPELEGYARAIEGTTIAMASRVLGSDAGEAALQAGLALSFAGVMIGLARHAARRQLYVPLEILQRHGAQAEDLFAGTVTAEWRAALGELRLRAQAHLSAVGQAITGIATAALPALLPLAPLRPLFDRMDRDDYDPLHPPELAAWRRQWRIWRVARKPSRIAG
jgi:phytoene synthase